MVAGSEQYWRTTSLSVLLRSEAAIINRSTDSPYLEDGVLFSPPCFLRAVHRLVQEDRNMPIAASALETDQN